MSVQSTHCAPRISLHLQGAHVWNETHGLAVIVPRWAKSELNCGPDAAVADDPNYPMDRK